MGNPAISARVNRSQFIRLLGIGVGSFLLVQAVGSCAQAADVTPAPAKPLTFVISWDDPKHANLKVKGGYTIEQGVIIAHTKEDEYVALSAYSTSDDKTLLVYQLTSNQFYCGKDGSRFDTKGNVVNGPATKPLTVYAVVANKTIGQFTITL